MGTSSTYRGAATVEAAEVDAGIRVSVIIPAFNEAETIGQCITQLYEAFSYDPRNFDYEIIVVDDGSLDKTLEEIMVVANTIPIKIMQHKKNLGKCRAIKTGLEVAFGDIICILDADLEYSPYDVPRIVTPIARGLTDAIYGSRFLGKANGMRPLHRLGNIILTKIANALYDLTLTDIMTGGKAFKKSIIKSVNLNSKSFEFEVEVTIKMAERGFKIRELPIIYTRRHSGKAKISYIDGLKCLIYLLAYKANIYLS